MQQTALTTHRKRPCKTDGARSPALTPFLYEKSISRTRPVDRRHGGWQRSLERTRRRWFPALVRQDRSCNRVVDRVRRRSRRKLPRDRPAISASGTRALDDAKSKHAVLIERGNVDHIVIDQRSAVVTAAMYIPRRWQLREKIAMLRADSDADDSPRWSHEISYRDSTLLPAEQRSEQR